MKTTNPASRLLATIVAVLMCVLLTFSLFACKEEPANNTDVTTASVTETSTPDEYAAIWADATYTKNITFGEGVNNFFLEVVVGNRSVTFHVNTDETVVGKALLAHGVISGDEGPYGLYVKTVNGMLADYDVNASYWSFCKDGEMMMTGVDMTDIENGAHYEMVYTK